MHVLPINAYEEFACFYPLDTFVKRIKTKTEFKVPFGTKQMAVNITLANNRVWFGLINDIFNTKKIRLREGPADLTVEELTQLSKTFDFIRKPMKYSPNLFSGVVNGCEDFENFYGVFRWELGGIYLMIFGTRSEREAQSAAEDNFGENIFYVHGIWKVDLSEEFKAKVFGSNV